VRRGALVVHLGGERHSCELTEVLGNGAGLTFVSKIDEGTATCIASTPFDGKIDFAGLGVAIAMTEATLPG